MELYFLTLIMALCGGMDSAEKGICVREIVNCRERISLEKGEVNETNLYEECLAGEYLSWFKFDTRGEQ